MSEPQTSDSKARAEERSRWELRRAAAGDERDRRVWGPAPRSRSPGAALVRRKLLATGLFLALGPAPALWLATRTTAFRATAVIAAEGPNGAAPPRAALEAARREILHPANLSAVASTLEMEPPPANRIEAEIDPPELRLAYRAKDAARAARFVNALARGFVESREAAGADGSSAPREDALDAVDVAAQAATVGELREDAVRQARALRLVELRIAEAEGRLKAAAGEPASRLNPLRSEIQTLNERKDELQTRLATLRERVDAATQAHDRAAERAALAPSTVAFRLADRARQRPWTRWLGATAWLAAAAALAALVALRYDRARRPIGSVQEAMEAAAAPVLRLSEEDR